MTFPTNKFSSVDIEQISDTRVGPERLKRYRSYGNKSPYWLISMTTPPLPYAEGVGLAAYLDGLLGALNTFDLPCPVPQLEVSTGGTVTTTVSKGVSEISVNTPNDCKAGDFLQLEGSKKVYRVTEDSLGAGIKQVKITPPVVESVSFSPSALTYGKDVVFQVAINDRSGGEINASSGKYITHDVELIEQL